MELSTPLNYLLWTSEISVLKFVLKCMKKSQTWAKYMIRHFYNPITTRQVQIVVQLIANYHLAVDFQSSSLGVKPGKKTYQKSF